jgi:hypothetical protein
LELHGADNRPISLFWPVISEAWDCLKRLPSISATESAG